MSAPSSPPRLDDRTILVTGANSGIGFAAAEHFLRAGARVILACRSAERGAEARSRLNETIGHEVGAGHADLVTVDLADLAGIRDSAARIREEHPRIDVLCNNAGVMSPPRRLATADGFELQFGVNHLGHFALTGLLLPSLLAAGASGTPARVVTVSSSGHRGNALDFSDLNATRGYGMRTAYGRSKLANLLFAYELDRRAKSRGLPLLSLACHPGVARSGLVDAGPAAAGSRAAWWLRLAYLGAQPASAGSLPTVHAATAPLRGAEFVGPSGFLQSRGAPALVPSSRQSHDRDAARRLWSAS